MIATTYQAVLFDVDGVLADTAAHHADAWRDSARAFGIDASSLTDDEFRGLSRRASLDIVLGGRKTSPETAAAMMSQKNARYLAAVKKLSPADALPGAVDLIDGLRARHIRVAAVSASRNARNVIRAIGLESRFELIVDGNHADVLVPNSNRYAIACKLLSILPHRCIAIDDSAAGVALASQAGMTVVGLGNPTQLRSAHLVYDSLRGIEAPLLLQWLQSIETPAA